MQEQHKPRVLGGYLVLPIAGSLEAIGRPVERAAAIRAARAALLAQIDVLDTLMDDTAIELRDAYNVKWEAVARRCGTSMPTIHRRVTQRRAARDRAGRKAVRSAA